MAAPTTSQSLLKIEQRRVGEVLVVAPIGRITEAFDAQSLARDLSGVVLFDMAGIRSITSYGVRLWIEMMNAAKGQLDLLFMARCPMTIVNQLNMVRGFAGGARMISFSIPYLCDSCQTDFEYLADVEKDGEFVVASQAPPATCPQCHAHANLDDDPQSYFSFISQQPNLPVPGTVREAMASLVEGRSSTVPMSQRLEKAIDGGTTTVRLRGSLDTSLHWDRICEGTEGALVIDFNAVSDVGSGGAARLERALRGLPQQIVSVVIEGCPQSVVERFASLSKVPRLTIASAVLPGLCGKCQQERRAVVDIRNPGVRDNTMKVPCERCHVPLSFLKSQPVLKWLGEQSLPSATPLAPAPVQSVAPKPASPPPPQLLLTNSGGSSMSAWRMPLILGMVAIAAIIGATVVMYGKATTPLVVTQPITPTGTAATAVAPAPAAPAAEIAHVVDLLPAWVERGFVIDEDTVNLVGHGRAAAEDPAIAAARNDALDRLSSQILQQLSGSPIYDYVRGDHEGESAPDVAQRVAERYLDQVGALATPERVEAVIKRDNGQIDAYVRYKLDKNALANAVRAYRVTSTFRGMVVARYFPTLERTRHGESNAMVVGAKRGTPAAGAGIKPGDELLDINGRKVFTVEDFARVSAEEWRSTHEGGAMRVSVQRGDERKELTLRKPVTTPPPFVDERTPPP